MILFILLIVLLVNILEISDLKVYAIRIPLIEEFKIALGVSLYYEGVIVEICTDEGFVGYGEGVPSRRITGETTSTILSVIENLKNYLLGKDPLEYEYLLSDIERMIIHNTAAKAAIEMAIFDIVSKKYGVPLKDLLGAPRNTNSFETSVTIGIMSKDSAVKKAVSLIERGVNILKIKIGTNPLEDIERLKAIRQAVGDDVRIRIDANQGYSVKQAIRVLRSVENLEIEYCEQPVYWKDLSGMRTVRLNTEIPIMADESVHTPDDAINVIKNEAADMINIKIMKTGGIRNSIKIAHICEAAGIPCQIGCMSETRIAISAGVHLAISLNAIKYSDLDGYLFLSNDIATGIEFKNSKNYLSNAPGLGVNINKTLVKSFMIS